MLNPHPSAKLTAASTELAEEGENIFDRHYRETGKELRVNLEGLDKATKAMLIKQSHARHQKIKNQENTSRFVRSSAPSPEPGLARENGRRAAREQ